MDLPNHLRRGLDAIGPTAHYTGHVWVRNGLSPPELGTREGRLMFDALAPAMATSRALGGPTLEGLLLARHRVIDALLTEAIEERGITQVIEPACGMAARGWRFTQRYGPSLTYVEGDLPEMAERKRGALPRLGSPSDRHRVVDLDLLRDSGPLGIDAVAAELDPDQGVAFVTEGLLTYFDQARVLGMWRRLARAAGSFRKARYLSDIRLGTLGLGAERVFGIFLSAFVRGRVHTHFADPEDAVDALRSAGFGEARLHRCDRHPAAGHAGRDPGARRVHIVDAGR
jgi:O-methyltransferase involved in polyketide biosynthesis